MHSKDAGCSDWTWGAGWQIPTRCFLGVARWFIGRLLLIPVLCMPVTLFPFAFGYSSPVEEGVTFTQVTNLETAGEF
jgi:hypothetical protein